MIEFKNSDCLWDIRRTLLVIGSNIYWCLAQRIHVDETPIGEILEYIIDGPNWLVEEVEARQDD